MEIDFLLAKPTLTRRKNIIPVEVKSSRKYDHVALDKFIRKFRSNLADPLVLHSKDIVRKNGINLFTPVHGALPVAGANAVSPPNPPFRDIPPRGGIW